MILHTQQSLCKQLPCRQEGVGSGQIHKLKAQTAKVVEQNLQFGF